MLKILLLIINLVVQWESNTTVYERVELDEFQNVYAYDATEIKKFDKSGINHFTFSTLRNGELTSLDVTNPLRLVVYFGENNEVLFLDNTLTEQGKTLNFNDLEYYDVGLVCSSFQNHLWVYRLAEQKLVRISNTGSVSNETGNLALWLYNSNNEEFVSMKESGNYLYLFAKSGLVMVFDHYGTYLKQLQIGAPDQFHVLDKYILTKKGAEIYSFNVELGEEGLLYEIPERWSLAEVMDFSIASMTVINDGKISYLKASR